MLPSLTGNIDCNWCIALDECINCSSLLLSSFCLLVVVFVLVVVCAVEHSKQHHYQHTDSMSIVKSNMQDTCTLLSTPTNLTITAINQTTAINPTNQKNITSNIRSNSIQTPLTGIKRTKATSQPLASFFDLSIRLQQIQTQLPPILPLPPPPLLIQAPLP